LSVARPSIYEFAGGDDAFLALAAAFHERCLADPVLNHPFSHSSPGHIERLAAYWAEVFGGPDRYTRLHGDHATVLGMHAGTDAEEAFGPRFVACFMEALDDAGLPDDAGFRASMRSYVEAATKEVMSYAPAGSQVPAAEQVPRWSWNGLE
jgi:hemoglobin